MQNLQSMLNSHPSKASVEIAYVTRLIEELISCAQFCSLCADSCLGEDKIENLRECIRINLDCAEVCRATASILSRMGRHDMSLLQSQLESCIVACGICANECEKHAKKHEHCRLCAEACRQCEAACQKMMGNVH